LTLFPVTYYFDVKAHFLGIRAYYIIYAEWMIENFFISFKMREKDKGEDFD
jgi:hypothetical protein